MKCHVHSVSSMESLGTRYELTVPHDQGIPSLEDGFWIHGIDSFLEGLKMALSQDKIVPDCKDKISTELINALSVLTDQILGLIE